MRAALIKNGVVENIVVVDSTGVDLGGLLVDATGARIGDLYDGVSFSRPADDVAAAKAEKIAELSKSCGAFIVGGFQSSALGTPHKYDSDLESQLNLAGAAALASPIPYTCTDAGGIKTARNHTAEQIKQVLADGAGIKIGALAKFRGLRDQVLAATTVDQVQAVVW